MIEAKVYPRSTPVFMASFRRKLLPSWTPAQ